MCYFLWKRYLHNLSFRNTSMGQVYAVRCWKSSSPTAMARSCYIIYALAAGGLLTQKKLLYQYIWSDFFSTNVLRRSTVICPSRCAWICRRALKPMFIWGSKMVSPNLTRPLYQVLDHMQLAYGQSLGIFRIKYIWQQNTCMNKMYSLLNSHQPI